MLCFLRSLERREARDRAVLVLDGVGQACLHLLLHLLKNANNLTAPRHIV